MFYLVVFFFVRRWRLGFQSVYLHLYTNPGGVRARERNQNGLSVHAEKHKNARVENQVTCDYRLDNNAGSD